MGCDDIPSFYRIGASVDAEGDVVIHYAPCDSEKITAVSLNEVSANGGDTVWSIRSEGSAGALDVVVGTTPDLFAAEVSLSGDLPEAQPLVAVVDTSVNSQPGAGAALEFKPSELRADEVFVLGTPETYMDPDDFRTRAAETCPES